MSELMTVREVATVLKCSEDAVSRRFTKLPGVIDLGQAETRTKRRYRVLRIPKAVVEDYLSRKAGKTVHVDVPPRPERKRRNQNWEDQAILNLAKAAVHNDCKGFPHRKTFQRIANRAQALSMLSEELWAEIMTDGVWCDEEEERCEE
jgi:predicted transcriptional regulator